MKRRRRAAKAEERARDRADRVHEPFRRDDRSGRRDHTTGTADLFRAAAASLGTRDPRPYRDGVAELAHRGRDGAAASMGSVLADTVGGQWTHGWQPADVCRYARHKLKAPEAAIVADAVVAQSVSYRSLGDDVAPGWMAQIDGLGSSADLARLHHPGHSWSEVVRQAVAALAFVMRLPAVPRLVDPPSTWGTTAVPRPETLPRAVLEKVRALLAKAESTTFEAEAEAFTAKAQELMARHRIDRAVVDATGAERREVPDGRRIGVDNPYADSKALLLTGVANANGCRVVWSKDLGFADTFGFGDDLDAVEELFTSLLVQATAALRREGSKTDGAGRSRTARFRRSFLVAFAVRISERLQATVDATVEAVAEETGTALVPLLAERDAATESAAAGAYPHARSFAPRVSDGEGWHAGTAFGDQADLGSGPSLSPRAG